MAVAGSSCKLLPGRVTKTVIASVLALEYFSRHYPVVNEPRRAIHVSSAAR